MTSNIDRLPERDGAAAKGRGSDQTRKPTHVTHAEAPVLPGISPLTSATMPRAEDDGATRAGSYEFHDRPGSGQYTADKHKYF